jgi:NAD(P)-dependent dehydrogenase (short-subunit alcohol dehydrogenase family)
MLGEGRTVVVLGGTGGIGRAVAEAAAATGARVVAVGRSSEPAVDVTSPASLSAFFAGVGPVDHLVYCAGDDLAGASIEEYDAQEAARFFDVRLFRALDAVRAALPTLRPDGSVTLTSGTAAYRGGAGWLLGAAVCGAVVSATRSLAAELAPVRVNAVAPGVVRTPLWSGLDEPAREAMYAASGAGTLLGRVAEPADVARAYVALMEQDYVTGTVALVDGGAVLS